MIASKTPILMVDDEIRMIEVYALLLRDEGYDVWTAATPDEALEIISRERIEIAFLDQFLGSLRGLDLMARMSGVRSDISYVMVTANGSTDLAVESLKRGASDFITKPFLVTDLLKSIDYVNKKQDLQRQKQELLRTLELKVAEKTAELGQVYTRVLASLAQAMEKKDIGTYGHSRRVSHHALLIAAALELGEADREDLRTAALLHDIGKIGITDFILGKSGPLAPQEFDAIKSHPQKGVEILSPLPQFAHILPSILHHHEHFDGRGYPAGLTGEAIPLHARIISVADTYDAIITNRPYRAGAGHDTAVQELVACSGSQFDPRIVKAFTEAHARRPESPAIGTIPSLMPAA
jgi:putative nucleotidyltransferase with HDIG domain